MRFSEWLLNEQASGLLFAKAVDASGLESILKSGFRLQGRQAHAAGEFSKGGGATEEQMYGPGLYFYMVPSEEFAKSSCRDYAGWGGSVVLASLKPGTKMLVTSWLPESHPAWKHSAAGHAGVYEQLEALGALDLFPDYRKGDTHVDPDWGYKLAGRVPAWLHQHNSRTHLVVYDPSVLDVRGSFECGGASDRGNTSSIGAPFRKSPSKVDPKTGREYDPSVPLDRQMRIKGLLARTADLDAVRRIQSDRSHPDHAFWSRFRVDSPAAPVLDVGLRVLQQRAEQPKRLLVHVRL